MLRKIPKELRVDADFDCINDDPHDGEPGAVEYAGALRDN